MQMELKKDLGFWHVFCIASGAMISSGLFILPGMAFGKAGPSVILSYIIAGLLCVPTVFSMSELITAMPKAGGDYFYIMRGFGPSIGTIAGFSTWFSLSMKSAFALIGIGAYLTKIVGMPLSLIAFLFCIFFILLNLVGVKEAARFQLVMVAGLIAILILYIAWGMKLVDLTHFTPFFSKGHTAAFTTASFVFISYGGLTTIVAVAEEVKNPQKNLPAGIFWALIITSVLYAFTVFITVGVLKANVLQKSLTPVSDCSVVIGGGAFQIAIGVAAFLAFLTTVNSGLMTASRYPFGMSRDGLLPESFQRISKRFRVPYIAVLFTGGFMAMVIFIKLDILVEVASAILILLYIFANLTIMLFRESKIASYKPKFVAPLYPYMQIIGVMGGILLLVGMGDFYIALTMMFVVVCALWYRYYVQKRVVKNSALFFFMERMISRSKELSTQEDILSELRKIVMQRDQLAVDKFHELVKTSTFMEIKEPLDVEDFFGRLAGLVSSGLGAEPGKLAGLLLEREKQSSTYLEKGLAIPHIELERDVLKLIMVRARSGIIFLDDSVAHAVFVIVTSPGKEEMKLKIMAAIAQIAQNPYFEDEWMQAANELDLKNAVLLAERKRE